MDVSTQNVMQTAVTVQLFAVENVLRGEGPSILPTAPIFIPSPKLFKSREELPGTGAELFRGV